MKVSPRGYYKMHIGALSNDMRMLVLFPGNSAEITGQRWIKKEGIDWKKILQWHIKGDYKR